MDVTLNKLPWYSQVFAFVALAASGTAAFHYYIELPMRAVTSARQLQLTALRSDNAKGNASAKTLPELRAQVADLESRLDILKSVLPEGKDAADLLRHMQLEAARSNLEIKGFKPNPVVTKPLHAEWPITLELEGTYHNLALFFDRVGRFPRLVNISGLDVKGKEKPEPHATITATCVATTFVLHDKPAPTKPAPKSTTVSSAVAANAAAEPFTYQGDGRRDPFLSLLSPEPESRPAPRNGDGIASLALAEITVRGILQSRDLLVAMIAGPDNKTYIVHEGDWLLDGQITGITREGLVIVQRVTDLLSRVKQRETRKLLQSLEAAKK